MHRIRHCVQPRLPVEISPPQRLQPLLQQQGSQNPSPCRLAQARGHSVQAVLLVKLEKEVVKRRKAAAHLGSSSRALPTR